MSWVTVIWSMTASACLTMAAIYFLVWCQRRTAWDNLLFTLTSAATAVFAGCELWMMRAETPAQLATLLRWADVPAWAFLLSLIGFIRLHLRAGRPWLGWTICVLWTLSLLLNFLVGQNLSYREVTRLRHITFLGESVAIAEGVRNPCLLVAQLSLFLFVIFSADAALTVWRRGDQRLALATGGSIVFCALTSILQTVLVLWQVVDWPLTASIFCLGIVVAMGYGMSHETLRAAKLSDDLRESEARMALAAEAAGVGIWMWTIATHRVWGSERWLALFGFAPDTAVSFGAVIQRIHPDDREGVERAVRHALETRVDYRGEYRVLLPDDTARWIVVRGRMYPDAQGKPARMMGVALDISERKQAEQESVQHRNELAHVARVSTMGQLASSLAHELNQPLGAILRNAEAAELFLQDPSPDLDEVRAILADIRKDDQRAGEVIERMRGLMKRRAVERGWLDVSLLAGEVLALVRPDADARRVALVLEADPALPCVEGDRVQLQQVLLNLVLNAVDAVKDNSGPERRVGVRVRRAGDAVQVSVSDNGHGIPADRLVGIFEPYFTTKPDGLGMGLAISRSIVEAQGGRLWAENNPARGATFIFTLPLAKREGNGEQ